MLERYNKIKDKFDEGDKAFVEAHKEAYQATKEMHDRHEKLYSDLQNINIIISDIDKQFNQKTGITNPKDMTFLWFAIGLQCIRWLLIENIDSDTLEPNKSDRNDAGKEGKKDKTASKNQLDKTRDEWEKQKYPSCEYIMKLPVPYDAMKGTEDIVIKGVTDFGVNICGTNHHSATLGHDVILGQVFGTANILTRTISFTDPLMTTRKVYIPSGREQIVLKDIYPKSVFFQDVINALKYEQENDDSAIAKKLVTALIKENSHLLSDRLTKKGLPIPLLSPGLKQQLLNMDWNTKELENIIKGSVKGVTGNIAVASLINTIVGILHTFCYNAKKDDDLKLYSVRTNRIISTSMTIAETINIAAVTGGVVGGICSGNDELTKKSIARIDIGGYIVAVHSIVESKEIQEKIRREYLEKELFNKVVDSHYSFL